MPSSLIRKIASFLLLLCFFLPLSTCSFKSDKASSNKEVAASKAAENTPLTSKDESLYAYDIVQSAFDDLRKEEMTGSIMMLLAVFTVFFLPVGLLALKEKPQAIVTILASAGAGFSLFFWVILGRTPQIGGVLAIICWSSLFGLSLVVLGRWCLLWWRQRQK
ncbi:hypothetical protein [Undibacterium pigrum]|uniref:Uncharacterized protein n=1 Tax=Undibacterium pigrum TaxID=401470 RepID=A0A318ITA7_9BURK|nr:hypothetical protein [Undibacterium pigrum]PXX37850.1 hypothetical protein DFR42_1149 [Undibacterium pigrum]